METKPLLYGLAGFFLGGLLVAVAATTFEKPKDEAKPTTNYSQSAEMSMDDRTASLRGKTGDEYDQAFIANMIVHHEGAVEMAKLSANNAKHDEIKKLSEAIITAQQKEIAEMKRWQADWGYNSSPSQEHDSH